MKKIFLLLVVTFTTFSESNSQNNMYRLSYDLSFQFDSTNFNKAHEPMDLFISNNRSLFMSHNNYLSDSIKNVVKRTFDPSSGKLDLSTYNIPHTKFPFFIYKEPGTTKIYYENMGVFKYTENPNDLCWEIQNETRTINGLKCQKALVKHGGRNYIAWFTTDIPINSGPYIFTGLPGLIVNIYDDRNHYNFNLTEIKKSVKGIPIEEPKYFQEITKMEFLKMMNDYRQNPIIHIKQFANINLSPEDIRRIKEREKRKNNPIELTAN